MLDRTAIMAIGLGLALPLGAAAQTQRVAFVTSVTGTGDLSTWADAGGLDGLAGADAVCQARAAAAGLADPGAFVAWLSDVNDDAYCRVHGLTGTKAANCGQDVLPSWAGPWVRPDGLPFARGIGELVGLSGAVLLPPNVDEHGASVSAIGIMTATDVHGVFFTSNGAGSCVGFTSAEQAESLMVGDTTRTGQHWTAAGTGNCNQSRHLLCLQTGVAAPLPPVWQAGALAFLTNQMARAELGTWSDAGGSTGTSAGDAICRAKAAAAGLPAPGSFMAWLSDSTSSAASRFTFAGPWTRLDGLRVAESVADLIDGNGISAPLNLTETGRYAGWETVWTGTASTGAPGVACSDWTSQLTGSAVSGYSNDTTYRWTQASQPGCSSHGHLYCFSQGPVVLMMDGFERGTTEQWAAVGGS